MNSNQILFATDFSTRSEKALEQCCRLALDCNALLNILYVKDPREIVKPFHRQVDPRKEFARFIPEDLAVRYNHSVLQGSPAPKILEFASELQATLIVLGTHGRTGFDRVFSGSVAEEVLRNAECPVMTIRETVETSSHRKLKRILVPVDFSVYGYSALEFASRLAIENKARVTVCHVDETNRSVSGSQSNHSEKASENQQALWKSLQKYTSSSSKTIVDYKMFYGQPGEKICDYANSQRYDYIILGTHGRTGLSRAIVGSVAEYVVRHANCPVITVKPINELAQSR
jgi:nucleotide-binding universal stress UspA family protein